MKILILSASNFKSFSWSLEQFFLTLGQNNFGNKIQFFFRIFSSRYCKWGKIMRIWNPSIDLPTYVCFDHLEMFWQINLLSWLSGAFLFDLDARLRLWSFKILSSDVALIRILQKVPRTFVKSQIWNTFIDFVEKFFW